MYGVGFGYASIGSTTIRSGVNPLWNGLFAYYSSDNTPNDSLLTYNATLINGTTYAAGKINNSFSFDGVNDYASISNDVFKPTSNYTISFWVNVSDLSVNRSIFTTGTGTSNGIRIFLNTSGNIVFAVNGGSLTTISTLSTSTWYHVSCVYDGTGKKIYLNGVLNRSDSVTTIPTWAVSGNICIFGRYITASYYMNGKIDEIALWDNRAITSAEALELYNSGFGKQYPN